MNEKQDSGNHHFQLTKSNVLIVVAIFVVFVYLVLIMFVVFLCCPYYVRSFVLFLKTPARSRKRPTHSEKDNWGRVTWGRQKTKTQKQISQIKNISKIACSCKSTMKFEFLAKI